MADSGPLDATPGKLLDSGSGRAARVPVKEYDIGTASVILKDEADGCSETAPHQITGTAKDGHTVKVEGTHFILLKDLTITYDDGNASIHAMGTCAFDIRVGAVVQLELVGKNILRSGAYKAGLHLPKGAKLTITAQDTTGILKATGAINGAGIGGHNDQYVSGSYLVAEADSCGELVVTGFAQVYADNGTFTYGNGTSASNAAGIGGGASMGQSSEDDYIDFPGGDGGTITVMGNARVEATGNASAPAIGGGGGHLSGGGGKLTILENGEVVLRGQWGSATGGATGSTSVDAATSDAGGAGGEVVLGSEDGSGNPTLTVLPYPGEDEPAGIAMGGNGGADGGKGGKFTMYSGTLRAGSIACGGRSSHATPGDGGQVNIYGGTVELAPDARLACGGQGAPGSSGGVVNVYGGSHDLSNTQLACGGQGGRGQLGGPGGTVHLVDGGMHNLTDALLACGGKGEDHYVFDWSRTASPTAEALPNTGDGGNGGQLFIDGGSHNGTGAQVVAGGLGGDVIDLGTYEVVGPGDGLPGQPGKVDKDAILYPVQVGSTPLADSSIGRLTARPGIGFDYNMTGVTTDSAGMLYLWLPKGERTIWVTTGGLRYGGDLAPVGQVTILKETAPEPEPDNWIVYPLRSGKDQSWQNGDPGLVFVVDTENGKFMGVGVDGELIDPNNYTYEGSTLTLKPEYLATLIEAPHSLRIRYSDGAAETTFTVVPGDPPTPAAKPNPGTGR